MKWEKRNPNVQNAKNPWNAFFLLALKQISVQLAQQAAARFVSKRVNS